MIYFFDIDQTICLTEDGDYTRSQPIENRIKAINQLFDDGHTINFWTARGDVSKIDWLPYTKNQLDFWGIKYHSLYPKPYGDVYVDDKAISDKQFFND